MANLLPFYIIMPIIFIFLPVLVVVCVRYARMCARRRRYGFYLSPPFELYEFSSVDISTRIATYNPTKEALDWARQYGKTFSPYRVKVQARRIHISEDNTPYLIGVWLSYHWQPWSWGVGVTAHSM